MQRLIVAVVAGIVLHGHCNAWRKAQNMMDATTYFEGGQLRLAEAIDKDSEKAISEALASGAKVDEAGREGVTPLMYALVVKKKNAVAELLSRGADPNKRAENHQNGMTLATRLAKADLDYLRALLRHKGDPNTREANDNPILITLVDQTNNDGIRLLAASGADLNTRDRTGAPAILHAALSVDWDCVWTLIQLGADWSVTDKGLTLAWIAYNDNLKPDSPVYPWLQRTVEFLHAHGVHFPPPSPQQVRAAQQPQP